MRLRTLLVSKIKKGTRVLMRVDANVPLANGRLKKGTDARLQAFVPDVLALQKRGAIVVLLSHLGRPNGKHVPTLSLKPVARRLATLLNLPVQLVDVLPDDAAPGEVYLLENLRFASGEESNSKTFAKMLAVMGDVYVNNAFSVSHRKHASVVAITSLLPSYAGSQLEREVTELSKPMKAPFVLVLGGIKLETKLPLLTHLSKKVDVMLLGSGLLPVGASLKKRFGTKVILPIDTKKSATSEDIGPSTIELFNHALVGAKSVLWNGPLGTIEQKGGAVGTMAIAKKIASLSGARTVVGGGDTIVFLEAHGMMNQFSFVSTGGGAMLAFLSGKPMPGIMPLVKNSVY